MAIWCRKKMLLLTAIAMTVACTTQQIEQGLEVLKGATAANSPIKDVTSSEAALGLKEALSKGAELAESKLAQKDGFLKNQAIKILIPSEFQKAEKALRDIGMGQLADQAVVSFNRAAEKAASRSAPILVGAITQMTFQDAMNILLGTSNEATVYLKNKTSQKLFTTFFPVVKESADQVSATKYWGDMAKAYNRIPLVKPIPADISRYITEKTLSGLFYQVEKEEIEIRKNPLARTTDLLKRVFDFADRKKSAKTAQNH